MGKKRVKEKGEGEGRVKRREAVGKGRKGRR